jgi:hypothetical protein
MVYIIVINLYTKSVNSDAIASGSKFSTNYII